MSVVELLSSLAKKDIRLWLENDNLRFSAPEGAFTPEVKQQVVSSKAEIIAFLKQAQKSTQAAIPKADRNAPMPASYSQQRLWILDQINPGDITYNMSSALRIKGQIDPKILESVFGRIVARHESLRTVFEDVDGSPYQIIQPHQGWSLPIVDLSTESEDERERQVQKFAQQETLTPFNLAKGPLFRAKLLVLGAQQDTPEFVLLASMHHIISDAWSMEVFTKEMLAYYVAELSGQPATLPELAIQYADYAVWQRQWIESPELKEHLEYWRNSLKGSPQVLKLPADKARSELPTSNGAIHRFEFDETLNASINQFCSALDLTPYMFMMGAWQLILGRFANQQDIIVGAPIAGRDRSDVQELIGFFVNMLLLRADLSGQPTVEAYYARIKEMVLSGFNHQEMPIDMLMDAMQVERIDGYSPLAQAGFQLINFDDKNDAAKLGIGPIQIEPVPSTHVSARMEMVLGIAKTGNSYSGSLEYNTDLFNQSTVIQLMDQFQFLVAQLVKDKAQIIDHIKLFDDAYLLNQAAYDSLNHSLLGLNANQRSMVLDELANGETCQNAYGIQARFKNPLDLTVLTKSVDALVNASPMLRARLFQSGIPGADDFLFAIAKQREFEIIEHDCSELSMSEQDEYILALQHRRYDIFNEALSSFHYVKAGEQGVVVVIACHHIALDGASTFNAMEKLFKTYGALLCGKPTDLSADNSQPINLKWDAASVDTPEILSFWKKRFSNSEPLSFSKRTHTAQGLAENESTDKISIFGDRVKTLSLEKGLLDEIRHYCAEHSISAPTFFKGLFAYQLQHYTRPEQDFAIYEFNANRQLLAADSLGCYYLQLPVLIPANAWVKEASIKSWFEKLDEFRKESKNMRALSIQAQAGFIPRGRLVCMYNFYNFVSSVVVDGETVQPYMSAPKVDGGVQFIVRESTDSAELEFRYDCAVFEDYNFLPRIVHLANQIVAQELEQLKELSFLSAREMSEITQAGSGASHLDQTNVIQDNVIQDNVVNAFERQVEQTPNAIALIYGEVSYSYSELNLRANALAHLLIQAGVEKGQRIGICLERSANFIIAVFGTLKAGAGYVPMDASYPKDRLAYLVSDSDSPFIITESQLAERLPESNAKLVFLDNQGNPETESRSTSIDPAIAKNPGVEILADDLIYIIFTSGSTGNPKGAAVTHGGESNLQSWYLNDLDFDAQSRSLLVSAVGFDLTQKNLFAVLLKGGCLVVPQMDLYDELAIIECISRHQITHLNCAPSAFYPVAESALQSRYESLQSLKFVVLGGEPIQMPLLYDWLSSTHCTARIVNSYGPTECTDVVAAHIVDHIDSPDQLIPLGRPINNVQLHVLNDCNQLVVPGCVGELCITGHSVGLGYLNKPELSAAVFTDNPFGTGKLYRTGDLVRYGDDGLLEYIGRKDFQIKLRGLRIELGEIETAIKELPSVKDGIVLVRDERLIGYAVSDNEQAIGEWREPLAAKLPDYMVPSGLVILAQWPLTPNGKIDRKALPDAQNIGQQTFVAPRNELELQLQNIWQQVLGAGAGDSDSQAIGVMDNLFELGGNSLIATRIISRVKKAFNIELQVRDLFLKPTIADLAVKVRYSQEGGIFQAPPIKAVDSSKPQPLSFAQQRLWFLNKLDPGSAAYNMPGGFKFEGEVNIPLLKLVFEELIERHQSLRTNFIEIDDTPFQVIRSTAELSLDGLLAVTDISGLSDNAKALEVQRQLQNEVGYSFDLATDSLLRVRALKLSNKEYVLLVNMHHIITDGWSNGTLMSEMVSIYEAFRNGRPSPLAPLNIQYADFSAWQRAWLTGDVLQRQIDFWQNTLQETPNLDLPFDQPRGATQTFNGAYKRIEFNAEISKKLAQLAKQQGASVYQTLLAAFNVLLHRYSGQQRFAVGTPIANRNRSELEPIIGFFVNTLAIATEFEIDESFSQQINRVRENTLDAYAHQDLPFERLVDELKIERDMSQTPIFQVMFNMVEAPSASLFKLPGLTFSPLQGAQETVKFDLMLDLTQQDGKVLGTLGYNTDLFFEKSISNMIDNFYDLVSGLLLAPYQPVSKLEFISREEKDKQLYQWNQHVALSAEKMEPVEKIAQSSIEQAIERPFSLSNTVHELFYAQALKTPDATAVKCGKHSLSYAGLNCAANRIAKALVSEGIKPNDRIGFCFDRSLHVLPALLGILKAGATYVPLDASYPAGRIRYIIEDAHIKTIVTRSDIAEQFPAKNAELRSSKAKSTEAQSAGEQEWAFLCVDEMLSLQESADVINSELDAEDNISVDPDPDRLLYMIYTSGSTGRPKGTGAYHRAEINLLNWYCHEFSMTPSDRVLLMSAIGFDLTQKNFFAPLVSGAALVIPEFQEFDAQLLVNLVDEAEITWINCAPSAFYPLQDNEADWPRLNTLREVFLGGEPINIPRLSEWLKQSSCQLVNSYGPTECTDIAAWYVLDPAVDLVSKTLPIGRPNDNVRLYIFDAHRQIIPTGAVGELYIGGPSVGPGYLGKPELTAEAFFQNPYTTHPDTLYKTGDRVRYRHDGLIEYLGRNDHQIKIRGVRIESAEIQAVINEQESVSDSLVAVLKTPNGEQLVAWVETDVAQAQWTSLQSALLEHLQKYLPSQMVPAAWCFVEKFPLTPNGKVDRKALPEPNIDINEVDYIAPVTETEEKLQDIWQTVLGLSAISTEANFFSLGGHSLLATQVASRIKHAFAIELPLRKMFEAPTIKAVAYHVDQMVAVGDGGAKVPPLVAVDRNQPLPLSFVQQQLWLLDQLDPGSSAYNMPVAVRLKGHVDVAVLNAAFTTVVERHETLRSRFVQEGDQPHVVIAEPKPFQVEVVDLTGLNSEEQSAAISQHTQIESDTGFRLDTGPLFRAKLLQCHAETNAEEWVLLATMHHIISDGWSMEVLVRELGALYSALQDKRPIQLPVIKTHYVDYAAWQRAWLQGEELEKQIEFWRKQLNNENAVLDLTPDFPRPAVQTVNGAAVTLEIPNDLIDSVRANAQHQGATLYMALLSAFKLVLQRYTGQSGINVGTPIAGRLRPEVEPLIGMFINSVVIATELEGANTYSDLLSRVKESALGAYAHQALPFEKIIEELRPKRDMSRTPFYQAFFNLLNLPESAQTISGLTIEPIVSDEDEAHAKFDLNLYVKETESGLRLHLVYNRDLFAKARMQRLLNHYASVIEQVAQSFTIELSTIELDIAKPQQNVLASTDPRPNANIELKDENWSSPVERMSEHASLHPRAQCLVDHQGELSYGEVEALSNQIAKALGQSGIGHGDVVAIYAYRNAVTVLSVLGVLKAGAIFTLLDPAYPAERIQHYLEASTPSALLYVDANGEPSEALMQVFEKAGLPVNKVNHSGIESINVSADRADKVEVISNFSGDQPSYIAYTSGTTGLPKVILGTLNPVAHFVNWYGSNFKLGASDRFSMLSGLAHDPLLRDIFAPLSVGASLIIPSPLTLTDPKALAEWFKENSVTVTHMTPAMCQLLAGAYDWKQEQGLDAEQQFGSLRLAAFGGDRLSYGTLKALKAYAPAAECVNFYGATETPQAMGFHRVNSQLDFLNTMPDGQQLPLGKGIDGAQLLVINSANKMASIGEVGEIIIRSPYLAQGYVGKSDSNNEVDVDRNPFIANPLRKVSLEAAPLTSSSSVETDRAYRTGDKGRYLEDGTVQFLGRMDQQIKIRGFRVEPGEIQHALNALENIKQSLVVDGFDARGDTTLFAYVVMADGVEMPTSEILRGQLRYELPEYMIPSAFIALDAIPLTPNGKIDKKALPDPLAALADREFIEPRTDVEKAVAEIWQKVLRQESISVNDNFFDVGGHSLLATQIVARVKELYNVEFSMRVLFEVSTIEGMANYVETTLWARGDLENANNAEDDDDMEEFEI